MRGTLRGSGWKRRGACAAIVLMSAALMAGDALAFPYASGDVIYVAYQSPSGPNYIVNLGPRTAFTTATTTFALPNVTASDLNGVIGATAPNIFVGLFGILNITTKDGIVSANGPVDDITLEASSIQGAVTQIDTFGNNVAGFSLAVPSGNPNAGKFTRARIRGRTVRA